MEIDEITKIVVLDGSRYCGMAELIVDAICIVADRFIAKCSMNDREFKDIAWEIDYGKVHYLHHNRVTREELLDHLKEYWPADFNAIIWHPELLDCQYIGDTE